MFPHVDCVPKFCTCSQEMVLTKSVRPMSEILVLHGESFTLSILPDLGYIFRNAYQFYPCSEVRARVKFWPGTDKAKSFTRQNLPLPSHLFSYVNLFYPSRTKNFLPCKWAFISKLLNESTETHFYSSFAVLLENNAVIFWKQNVCTCREHNIGLVGCRMRVKVKPGCMMTRLLNYGGFSGGVWD